MRAHETTVYTCPQCGRESLVDKECRGERNPNRGRFHLFTYRMVAKVANKPARAAIKKAEGGRHAMRQVPHQQEAVQGS